MKKELSYNPQVYDMMTELLKDNEDIDKQIDGLRKKQAEDGSHGPAALDGIDHNIASLEDRKKRNLEVHKHLTAYL